MHFINDSSFTGANDFATTFCPSMPFSFLTYPDIVRFSQRRIQSFWSSVMVGRCQWVRGNFNFCLKGRIMEWGIPVRWCYIEWLLHWGLHCEILGSWVLTPLQGHHLQLAHSWLWFLFLLPYICMPVHTWLPKREATGSSTTLVSQYRSPCKYM